MADAEWGDLEPYFENAVVFVEWPEAGDGVLPPARVRCGCGTMGRHIDWSLSKPPKKPWKSGYHRC